MSGESRLLVVDDEPVVCESCKRIFECQGFSVEISTDSREGLRRAEEANYSAILLDIRMPELDGIQFLEQLRRTKRDIPVIMITGHASVTSAVKAMRLGAADYVTKPFTPDEIETAVQRLLVEREHS